MKSIRSIILSTLLSLTTTELLADSECGAVGVVYSPCHPVLTKIISEWSNGHNTIGLSDDEIKELSVGFDVTGHNGDGEALYMYINDKGGKAHGDNSDYYGKEWCTDIRINDKELKFVDTACPVDPPVKPNLNVYCHCDPEGRDHSSMDYFVGSAFDKTYEGQVPTVAALCGKCDNNFCRDKSGYDHIKSYKCYSKKK